MRTSKIKRDAQGRIAELPESEAESALRFAESVGLQLGRLTVEKTFERDPATRLITKIISRPAALERPETKPDPRLELAEVLVNALSQMPRPSAPGPAATIAPLRRRDLREVAGLVWRSTLGPALVEMGHARRRSVIVDPRVLGVPANARCLSELLEALRDSANADVEFWRRAPCARLGFRVATERPAAPVRIGAPRPGRHEPMFPAPWFEVA